MRTIEDGVSGGFGTAIVTRRRHFGESMLAITGMNDVMNLLDALLHPERDENPERALVAHAANLLEVGEFQLVELAFAAWFGREMTEAEGHRYFDLYCVGSRVPPWLMHFARTIIEREANGELNEHEPHYHRFDRDYRSSRLPNGVRQFIVAVTIVCGVLGGAIVFASYSADCGASQYPPCFSHAELGETEDGVPAPRTAR